MGRSYRQIYHANVPSGWANDPNGTIFFHDRAHLFYQHYPHQPQWGIMHWGHFTTGDFIHWEAQPVALIPDQPYEALCGCCSGSAIEVDGRLWLMYTAAQPDLQRQCIAVSDDGIHFEKSPDNPVITADMMNPEVSPMDFRDPRMFRHNGAFYLIAGARIIDPDAPARAGGSTSPVPKAGGEVRSPSIGDVSGVDPEKDGYGNLVLLRSDDLRCWRYVGHLLWEQPEFDSAYYQLNGVYECPDYFTLDGEEVLLSSPQNLPQMGAHYQNIHSTLYMLGKLDYSSGRFRAELIEEIDAGFDFYAAQTLRMPDGRVVMIAWKEMWDRSYPTQAEGWAGTYTLPRELRVVDRRLIQRPVRELTACRANRVACPRLDVADDSVALAGVEGGVIEIDVTLEPGDADRAGLKLFCGGEHETLIYFDRASGCLVFDRSHSGIALTGREENVQRRVCPLERADSIRLELFLDVSSIEVFINGGQRVMTGNVYPDPEDTGVRFFSEGGKCMFVDIEKFDIVV